MSSELNNRAEDKNNKAPHIAEYDEDDGIRHTSMLWPKGSQKLHAYKGQQDISSKWEVNDFTTLIP